VTAPLISVEELAAARAGGPVALIDVRQPEEYEAAHVPGAKLIPLANVVARTGEIPRQGPVFVICHTGSRSQRAADYYRNLGIEAYNVDGGTRAWVEAGLETAGGLSPG